MLTLSGCGSNDVREAPLSAFLLRDRDLVASSITIACFDISTYSPSNCVLIALLPNHKVCDSAIRSANAFIQFDDLDGRLVQQGDDDQAPKVIPNSRLYGTEMDFAAYAEVSVESQ